MKTKPGDDENPVPERDQKRPRLTPADAVVSVDTPPPPPPLGPLPAELWANVIDSLGLGEMIQACLISRSFLREVIPRVTEIEVDHADQMRAFVGRRFSGVTAVRIGCLFEYYDYRHCQCHGRPVFTVNDDAINRSSPFLSNFVGLENISFFGTASLLSSFAEQDDAADLIPEGNETIKLYARDQVTGEETMFKVKKRTKMSRVFFVLALRKGLEASSLRFFMGGNRVKEDDTSLSLRMQDRAVLDYTLTSDSDGDDDEGVLTWNEKRVSFLDLIRIHGDRAGVMQLMAQMIDRESETFRSLVRSIGGFVSSCAIKQTAIVSGLLEMSFCAKARSGSQNNDCTYCSYICSSFPCNLVLTECIEERESIGASAYQQRRHCICLSTEKALALVRQRPESLRFLESPYFLIASLINEKYNFIRALVKVGLPEMTRAEVKKELARWRENGHPKPTISFETFKMLTVEGRIPLEQSDFGKIYGFESDFDLDHDSEGAVYHNSAS